MLKTTIFIFALVNLVVLIKNLGVKSSLISCGLVGYNGSIKPNELLLRIMGKFNEKRGTHSCGISNDYEIRVGVGKKSVFSDFIEDESYFAKYKKTNNVIIHTRKATVGAHTAANAHPFGFGGDDDSEESDFIGAHNGSLLKWEKLMNNVDVPKNVIVEMDSQALLYRLYIDKNYKVLSEYMGAAALLFYNKNEPDALYTFKGAAGDVEERPLFYVQMRNDKNKITGVYLSSMAEPFIFAGIKPENIKQIPNNYLYKFKDGKITTKIKISRPEKLSSTYRPVRTTLPSEDVDWDDWYDNNRFGPNRRLLNPRQSSNSNNVNNYPSKNVIPIRGFAGGTATSNTVTESILDIINESESCLHNKITKGNVYYRFNRYWQNGHRLHGLYLIHDSGKIVFSGEEDINKLKQFKDSKIEDDKRARDYYMKCHIYCFYSGIMAENEVEYNKLLNYVKECRQNQIQVSMVMLAKYSRYTVYSFRNPNSPASKLIPLRPTYTKLTNPATLYTEAPLFSLFLYRYKEQMLGSITPKIIGGGAYFDSLLHNVLELNKDDIFLRNSFISYFDDLIKDAGYKSNNNSKIKNNIEKAIIQGDDNSDVINRLDNLTNSKNLIAAELINKTFIKNITISVADLMLDAYYDAKEAEDSLKAKRLTSKLKMAMYYLVRSLKEDCDDIPLSQEDLLIVNTICGLKKAPSNLKLK